MSRQSFWFLAGLAAGGLTAANRYRRMVHARSWRDALRAAGPQRPIALVTGASSGIGAVFGRALAAQGYDLILTARREARLNALADVLRRELGVRVEVVAADLSLEAGIAQVEASIERAGGIDLLVNNAGYGLAGNFAEVPLEQHLALIECLELACIRLARAALPGMLARRQGAIINVASTAGFVALPRDVLYSTTKSALITFSQALALELAGTGVRVQALCPGFTHTEFHDDPAHAAAGVKRRIPGWLWMQAEDVVSASLHALSEDRVVVVPGLVNQAIVAGARLGLAGFLLGSFQTFFLNRAWGARDA